jgi:Xaa-Pro aminopeptidase
MANFDKKEIFMPEGVKSAISMQEYQQRRNLLSQQLKPGSVLILSSNQELVRNNDINHKFRQDSDFYYLTGLNEPNAILVLSRPYDGKLEYILFNQKNDPAKVIWEGKVVGQEGAIKTYLADKAFDIKEADKILPEILLGQKRIFYPHGKSNDFDQKIVSWLQATRALVTQKTRQDKKYHSYPEKIINCTETLHRMRLVKSDAEVNLLREAAKISALAHNQLMINAKAGLSEKHLDVFFEAHCRQSGCSGLAYPNIVASGENACILHYEHNNCVLKDGDLILVDAGGEIDDYAADITRTFPVNGQYTPAQKRIYEIVLSAQQAGIDATKPGVSYNEVSNAVLAELARGLLKIGVLSGTVEENITNRNIFKYMPHGVGHWLGLDVHDQCPYYNNYGSITLKPNMAFTIEPGLYFSKDDLSVPEQYRGIGIRIEDDILVTQDGCENMSRFCPRTVADIERLLAMRVSTKPVPVSLAPAYQTYRPSYGSIKPPYLPVTKIITEPSRPVLGPNKLGF